MPAPLDVNKEAVKTLVLAVGVAEAARQTGIDLSTVKQWSARGKWLAHLRPENAPKPPASMRAVAVTGVTSPSDALANALAEDRDATTSSLSKAARRAALAAELADLVIETPSDLLALAKAHATIHRLDQSSGGSSINILIQS